MNEKEWEGEMSTEFDRRVRDLHEAPLSFDQVRGKAVTIQRKRRAVVAGGVLAAAAVVVPVAVAAANGLGDATPREVAPATQTTSATDAPTPTTTPEAPSDPDALGVGYLEGRTYHRADGTFVSLPRAYQDATAIADEVFAWSFDEQAGQFVVDAISADGGVANSFPVLGTPVSDRDGELVAFVDVEGTLVVQWAGGEAALTDGLSENTQVVAVTGGPTCEAGSDCRVVTEDQSVQDGQRVVTADGDVQPVPDGVISIRDVNEDGVAAVLTSYEGVESCGGLFDLGTGEYLVESCDYSFMAASPDGTYAAVSPPYLDGLGSAWTAIADGDGTEVARFEPGNGGFVGDPVWEDAEHVLVPTFDFEAGEWTVVRLGVDGSQEVVAGPVRGTAEEPVFVF